MRRFRMTAMAVLLLITAAGTASAQCVSDVREIYSRSSSSSLVAGPFAWSGSILAVAAKQVSTGSMWLSFFSETGDQLFPNTKVPSTENSELIDVVWTGTEFGFFYESEDHRFMLRRVSTTGELIGGAIEPLTKTNVRLGDTDDLDIIWSSKENAYLVARTVNTPSRSVRLTTIERTGALRDDKQIAVPAPNSLVRVGETESGIIAVFYEQDGTRHIMMAPFQDDDLNLIRKVWPQAGTDLVIAARANDFVLARTMTQSDARKAIRWKIVDSDGNEVREEARLAIGTGKDVAAVSILARGNEIALGYLESRDGFDMQVGSYRIRRVTTEGEILSDTFFAAADSTRRRAQSKDDFVWTGTAFLTVAVRDTEAGDDSFIIRLCPLKAEISGPRVLHPGNTVTYTATVEGGVPSYEYSWKWGEFNTATGPSVPIRIDAVGTHRLTLTVTDISGMSTLTTFDVTVAKPVQPRRRSVRK